ncbi:tRNA-dihydrouridine synthase [Clostridium sp. AM58-1XD]|uniref:tRNA dihydrouridine synthase n=1 Tax=Clostridium sp. AM58-1XD TaxID=2292307 RepID=UPI000E4B5C70|nr:tRNA-dihydrouridine synthase [Clostridium sp. AM58-1XD]RGZ01917.1 diguanylate cyclase [Clostridium sp. AM58-1XD]
MKYYFAPMEGITWYIYRNAHHAVFGGIDTYYTPFIVPTTKKGMRSRELNDIIPENNREGIRIVPQILTNKAEDFLSTAEKLKAFGYDEVNLNLGCPSGTVVAKGKGSGFLADPDGIDRFLDTVCSSLGMKLSVKTRIGKESPDEFGRLLEIFNRYPLEMLIVHPRVQKDYYKNYPNLCVFREALKKSRNPVCYNGDLFSEGDLNRFTSEFPEAEHVMIGRGLVRNPALVRQFISGEQLKREELKRFHDDIYEGYSSILSGDRNILFRMKELWAYMIPLFEGGEKAGKKIKKAEKRLIYEEAVKELFEHHELIPEDSCRRGESLNN